jgi:hypothetical protein
MESLALQDHVKEGKQAVSEYRDEVESACVAAARDPAFEWHEGPENT